MERKYRIIKLSDLSPMHLAIGKDEYSSSSSSLDSDIMSSAIAGVRANLMGGDDTQAFISSFSISSCFPYSKDILFMPKPQGRTQIVVDGIDETLIRKRLKKIKFLELGLWKDLICRGEVHVRESQIKGEYILPSETGDFRRPYESDVNQRASVPRDGEGDTAPFFFEWQYFQKDSGLFFIVESSDETFEEILRYTKELGEVGIGSDKNVGGGHFNAEPGEISLPICEGCDAVLLLSSFIPTEEDIQLMDLSRSVYTTSHRTGFIAGSSDSSRRHFYRKSIHMLRCGSCLKTGTALHGKVVDLKPDNVDIHPVYRSGKPLYIPIVSK